jgi:Fanconi-associated nuclease 1
VAGYIDMLSCTVDPSEYDMKEILDVLSVPEMKEILKELQKVFNLCLQYLLSSITRTLFAS